MEEAFNNILSNSSLPALSAFMLGLLTAISPCPLATNITAIGYISKEIDDKKRIFIYGLLYTLGRALAYTALAVVIFIGADQLKVSELFNQYGEKVIGPLLIIIGVLMLDIVRIKIPVLGQLFKRDESKGVKSAWDIILLGVVFALAFCPYSGVLYFGMLIPLSISSVNGLYLPVIYAIATGIPVIIFAWLLAYTVAGVGKFYNRLKSFEFWFRRLIAVLFIAVGIYYIIVIYF